MTSGALRGTRGGAAGLGAVADSAGVLITCGAGGVGKTTIAAAIGVGAAMHSQRRVLVLTIDPARRLADALGLQVRHNEVPHNEVRHNEDPCSDDAGNDDAGNEAPDNEERRVELDAAALGSLWVSMLDTSAAWDDLVRRHAPDAATGRQILANRLYRNITQRFVHSHDYIAMERLHNLRESGRYDLVVIDTPPSRHALDFLDAPDRMAEFFSSPLLRWITLPYRRLGPRAGRLGYFASKPFSQVADRILGSVFLEDVAEFFLLFQSMYEGFVARARTVAAALHDDSTAFVVVATPEPGPLGEADYFIGELGRRRMRLGALVVNRVLPDVFLDDEAAAQARRVAGSGGTGRGDAEVFLDYARQADRQRAEAERLPARPDVTVMVALRIGPVDDLGAVASIGERVWFGTGGSPVERHP